MFQTTNQKIYLIVKIVIFHSMALPFLPIEKPDFTGG